MGANIFRSFPTIPAASSPGVTATIVGSDLEDFKTFLLAGDMEGVIRIEGTTDGVNFSTIAEFVVSPDDTTFTIDVEPNVIIPAPQFADAQALSMRARLVQGTVREDVVITVGAEENCDCISGGGAFGSIVSVDAGPNDDGVAATGTRSDHKHEVITAAPTAAIDIGDAAAVGVALTLARSDHQHPVPAPVAAPPDVGTAAIGVLTTPARSDHTHGLREVPQDLCFSVLTPPIITVTPQNDYNPTDFDIRSIIRIETTIGAGGVLITGMVPPTNPDGCIRILENVSSVNAIELSNADAGSAAANRFEFFDNIRLNPFESLTIKYDSAAQGGVGRWHIFTGAIADQAVSNRRLRDSSSRSVIGRAAATSGTPGDIIAGADGDVLQRLAGVLVFAPSPAAAGIAPVDFYADQGMIDSTGADWPTSVVAPAAPDAVKSFMATRELVDDAVTGFGLQFDVPTGTTQVQIRIWSRGTGTTGPWVPILRAVDLPDNAAIGAFAAEEPMTALSMPADTDGQYDTQTITYADIGALVAGNRAMMQITRDKAGQAGDTLATSVFIYHVQLVFS